MTTTADDGPPSLHSLSVQLAELRGQVGGLTQLVGQRIDTVAADLKRETEEADTDHERIYAKIREQGGRIDGAQVEITELKGKWNRAVGLALGIGIGSGIGSGAVVGVIIRTLGG